MAMLGGDDREVLKMAAALLEAGEPFVMATVISTRGSTPRDAGARMLWRPHGAHGASDETPNGAIGTIGGGQFEHLVLDAMRSRFAQRSSGIERLVLGADADQCCGGTMEVFVEHHAAATRVVIFGAGHVSQALCRLLEPAALAIAVVDDRAEWNTAERFPRARLVHSWDEGVALTRRFAAGTLALVMTCSHETDFELLRGLLADAGIQQNGSGIPAAPVFTGLIGSRSKRACLFSRLTAAGIGEDQVRQVHCPIGVGDTGKEPHAVAVSVAAQLLMEARSLAEHRSAKPATVRRPIPSA